MSTKKGCRKQDGVARRNVCVKINVNVKADDYEWRKIKKKARNRK